ncbi:hypothetical protein GCM10023116_13060 [Kistimonas scapharcae]|uniref:Virion morphogenesis protein n=1 Tax=Kistimonas scapharcae TaxID=1036133 RepID=A0ABP8UZG0_9GAMM
MTLKVTLDGDFTLRQQLQALRLTPAKQRRYHQLMGREVIKASRGRIKGQRDLNGQPWAARKNGRKRMLTKIMRGRNVKVYAGKDKVTVTWPNRLMGQIARRQQDGIAEPMTARRMAKIHGENRPGEEATAAQAKALKAEGFKVYAGKYKSGKTKTRRTSQKWIKENMSKAQAGLVLRLMREEQVKTQWDIPLPERSFLGLSDTERAGVGREILTRLTTEAATQSGKRG